MEQKIFYFFLSYFVRATVQLFYSIMQLLSIFLFFTLVPFFIFRSSQTPRDSTLPSFVVLASFKFSVLSLHQHCHFRKYGFSTLSIPKSCTASQFGLLILLAGDISINPGPTSSNVNFGFTNVRSIKNKYASLDHYITTNNIHITGLSETWLSPSDTTSLLSEITPSNHILHSTPRSGKRGGGVGFFVHKSLEASTLKTKTYKTFEHIVMSVKLGHSFYNCVSLYKPPNISFSTFIDEFTDFIFCFTLHNLG